MSTVRKTLIALGVLALLGGGLAITSNNATEQAVIAPASTTSAAGQPTSPAVVDITPTTTGMTITTGPAPTAAPSSGEDAAGEPLAATPASASPAQTPPPMSTTTSPVANPPTAANQIFAADYNVVINQSVAAGTVFRVVTSFTGVPAGTEIPFTNACSVGTVTCSYNGAPTSQVLLTCSAPGTHTVTVPITLPGGASDSLNITVNCTA